jgi:dTDP-4-amino-4,6-dideoxygalactose transaminase
MTGRLAVAGGEPAFPDGVPFVKPAQPPLDRVVARLRPSYDRGVLTNGPLVRELEEAAAVRLDVPHAVAVASCTTGLMLTLQAALAESDRPDGVVLMPSFTFSATAHAAVWAGGAPRFADCDPASGLLDLADAAHRLDGAAAVVATHVFGAPCDPDGVEAVAQTAEAAAVFDAAHAFGARHAGRPVGGRGLAEVFSLSPTKPLVAGEGGLVTTRDPDLAARLRHGRDYGNPGDYDTRFPGLNARLSELHAAVALEALVDLDEHLARRRQLAGRYAHNLAPLDGVDLQRVDEADESTFKDLTIVVDEARYGAERDDVVTALRAEGVDTRCYFWPPVHRQHAYRAGPRVELPHTDWLAARVISLPIWRDLADDAVDRICEVFHEIHAHPEAVRGEQRGRVCASS